MVVVSNDWIENAEDTKTFLGQSGLIMASSDNNVLNSTDNTGKNEWNQQQQQLQQKQLQSGNNSANNRNSGSPDSARAILICHQNSHAFQTRTLILEPNVEVKVGRSIARNRVSENNAIFDCKVLSRNHAVIWYADGKFYVKDTRSSNGTFINERKINPSEREELSSCDIVKFGVDVIENSRKEVHGCIIACVKLYLPDGRETISNRPDGTISLEKLHSLHHFISEAVQREKILESKMHDMQKVVDVTRRNTSTCWQAMIDEDRLLNRIDLLENKLKFFEKNLSEDRLRDEIVKLQDDKSLYQSSAKEALRKVYLERMEAMHKLTAMERALYSSEDECSMLRDQLLRTQQNLQEMSSRYTQREEEFKEINERNENEVQTLNEQLRQRDFELQLLKAQVDSLNDGNKTIAKEDKEPEEKSISDERKSNQNDDQISKSSSKKNESSTRNTVMKWLENSDLKNKDGAADIFKAICNDETNDDSGQDINLSKLQEKLISIEKNLDLLETEACEDERAEREDDENSVSSTDTISDGNQNLKIVKPNDSFELLRTTTVSLKDVYNELSQYSRKVDIYNRAQDAYDELESKLNSVQDELKTLQMELETRPTYNQFQDKIKLADSMQFEVEKTNSKLHSLEEKMTELEREKSALQKSIEESMRRETQEIGLQTEYANELFAANDETTLSSNSVTVVESIDGSPTQHLSIDDEGIQSDLAVINSAAVQQEEELILYKEKYDSILNEHLALKQYVGLLKTDLDTVQKQFVTKFMICAAIFIAFFSYIFYRYF